MPDILFMHYTYDEQANVRSKSLFFLYIMLQTEMRLHLCTSHGTEESVSSALFFVLLLC